MYIRNNQGGCNLSIVALFSESKGIGLKKLTIISYGIASLFCILIVAWTNLLFFWIAVFFLFLSSGSNAISTYTSSFYPTKIRDSALGFFYACTRIGGFLSQFFFLWLFNLVIMLPYYLMLVLSLGCLVCVLFLKKEMSGQALDR